MAVNALFLTLIIGAALPSAAEPIWVSSLSGPWKGEGVLSDGQPQAFQLTVSVSTHPFVFRAVLRNATKTVCEVRGTDEKLASATSFSLPCAMPEGRLSRQSSHLDFESDYATGFRVLWGDGNAVMRLNLTRLNQDTRTRFEGDWVSEWPKPGTCVLHIYRDNLPDATPLQLQRDFNPDHLIAFLDRPPGIFGVSVALVYSDDKPEFSFSLQGVRSEMFEGTLHPERQEITGEWAGHPFCSSFSRILNPK